MPAPSTITASDINTELGKGSTTILRMNDANTRNLACKSSGTVSFGNCRWGINFPGGVLTDNFSYSQQYDYNDLLSLVASDFVAFDGVTQTQAATYLTFFANGVMQLECTAGGSQKFYNKTWLTSGSAGNYTVQFLKTSGTSTITGSSTNTDLAMSTDRQWILATNTIGPGTDYEYESVGGTIIVKDSGGTLIERPITMSAEAEISI